MLQKSAVHDVLSHVGQCFAIRASGKLHQEFQTLSNHLTGFRVGSKQAVGRGHRLNCFIEFVTRISLSQNDPPNRVIFRQFVKRINDGEGEPALGNSRWPVLFRKALRDERGRTYRP